MTELLLERWIEPPADPGLHLSTLIQQVLSLIAQHGGVRPLDAYRTLCSHGPFGGVNPDMFASLLRALAGEPGKYNDMLMQSSDGLLLLGTAGERLVGHYSFYAAFRSAQEYRLVANGKQLGMLPIDYPVLVGSLIIFGGRRWKVIDVDDRAKLIELTRSTGGKPPTFTGDGGALVADRVRREMFDVYVGIDVPAYLDAAAVRLLGEGRANFAAYELSERRLLRSGADTMLFGWMGDRGHEHPGDRHHPAGCGRLSRRDLPHGDRRFTGRRREVRDRARRTRPARSGRAGLGRANEDRGEA